MPQESRRTRPRHDATGSHLTRFRNFVPNPFLSARRVEEGNGFPLVAAINAKVVLIGRKNCVARVQFAHADQAEIGEIRMAVSVAAGELLHECRCQVKTMPFKLPGRMPCPRVNDIEGIGVLRLRGAWLRLPRFAQDDISSISELS